MNIPSEVKISCYNYKVNMIDGPVIDGNDVCYGNIQFDKGIINIANINSDDLQKCTLIHECLHGINDIVEAKLNEDQTRLMAKGLYTFIKDNPNVFKYL